MVATISSVHNPRIKNAVRLRDRPPRDEQQCTLIDGLRELALALRGGIELVEVFYCDEFVRPESASFVQGLAEQGWPLVPVTPRVFEKLAYGNRAEGVVAVARTPRRTLHELPLTEPALVAVLEGVEKPGNVGAVLRSADAAGVSAVVLAGAVTDLYNPNAIRSSQGAIFTVPVCSADRAEVRAWLRGRAWPIYATRVDGAVSYASVSYKRSCAVVLGSEAAGLSEVWRSADITPIALPMRGAVDSLNVSVAAAVVFYEALRQRTLANGACEPVAPPA